MSHLLRFFARSTRKALLLAFGLGVLAPAGVRAAAAPRAATTPKAAATKRATSAGVAKSGTPSAAKPGTRQAAGATRTLDAVHIEGELDVPEVLFITARDQRHIVGFQHRRYLPGSADVARATPLPSHVVVGRKPVPPREENPQ